MPIDDDDLSWLEAMRRELDRYQNQEGDLEVQLDTLYAFSEARLARQFPDNNHIRAKIRQQLQRLRDRDEIEFVDDQGTYRITGGDAIDAQKTALLETLESAPQLTESETAYTQTTRRARDHAFASIVKQTYDNTCAICGSRRETPTGNPEVEAAHIYPKREGGADDPRDGIALCKLHHWAFDTGWLASSDSYSILVAEASDKEGYHEFSQLAGTSIQLPNDTQLEPHERFISEHRRLHGF